jgi:predicted DNA-binding transcriptional regulator AlpA
LRDTIPLRPAPDAALPDLASPAGVEKTPRDSSAVNRPSPLATAVEPLLLAASEAARLCGISQASWYRMVSAGRCPAPVRLSRGCVRWSRETLVEWIRMGCPPRKEFETRLVAGNASGRPRQAGR